MPPPLSVQRTTLCSAALVSCFRHSILLRSFLVLPTNYTLKKKKKSLFPPLLLIKSLSHCIVSSLRTRPLISSHCCIPSGQQSPRRAQIVAQWLFDARVSVPPPLHLGGLLLTLPSPSIPGATHLPQPPQSVSLP